MLVQEMSVVCGVAYTEDVDRRFDMENIAEMTRQLILSMRHCLELWTTAHQQPLDPEQTDEESCVEAKQSIYQQSMYAAYEKFMFIIAQKCYHSHIMHNCLLTLIFD